MTNGAIATFSSPVICSFGLSGSLSFTSRTPAVATIGNDAQRIANAIRFIGHLPAASVPAAWVEAEGHSAEPWSARPALPARRQSADLTARRQWLRLFQ